MAYTNYHLSAFYLGALASFIQRTLDEEQSQIKDIQMEGDATMPYITYETPEKIHMIRIEVRTEDRGG